MPKILFFSLKLQFFKFSKIFKKKKKKKKSLLQEFPKVKTRKKEKKNYLRRALNSTQIHRMK